MELIYLLYTFILKIGILLFVFTYGYLKRSSYLISNTKFILLFIVHFAMCVISWMLSKDSSDAITYYNTALASTSWLSLFGTGASFIKFIIYPFVKYLKFDFLLLFILFSSISFYGFLIFNKILMKLKSSKPISILGVNVATIILFLPGFHLWTSPMGKDSLTLYLTMALFYKMIFLNKQKIISVILIIVALFFIRFYIIVYLFLGLTLYYAINALKKTKYFLWFTGFIIVITAAYFIAKYKFNIDVFEYIENKLNFVTKYAVRKIDLGSYINPKYYNILQKIIIYLFGPDLISAQNLIQRYVALENILLLIIIIKGAFSFSFSQVFKNVTMTILFFYSAIFLFVNAYFIYNLGLANRQKFMIIPVIIIILTYSNLKKQSFKPNEYK